MTDFLTSDLALTIATFLAGIIATLITLGTSALIKSFKSSSNKLDDAFIPVLEEIRDALKKDESE